MKYVVMDNMSKFGNVEGFVIFPEIENHKKVVESLGGVDHLVSAGFVSFHEGSEGIEACCHGVSVSLGISSRKEEDSAIITRELRGY